jgi:hypothetical protein
MLLFESQAFDIVYSNTVIEHLDNYENQNALWQNAVELVFASIYKHLTNGSLWNRI